MIRVRAPALEPGEALRRLTRGERPFLLDGGCDADGLGRLSWAGCDPDDGLVWSRGDAGDPLALVGAAQRRWNAGPVDEFWPFAVGYRQLRRRRRGAGARVRAAAARARATSSACRDVDFARYRAVWRRDNATGTLPRCWRSTARRRRRCSIGCRARRRRWPSPSLGAPRWSTSDDEYRRARRARARVPARRRLLSGEPVASAARDARRARRAAAVSAAARAGAGAARRLPGDRRARPSCATRPSRSCACGRAASRRGRSRARGGAAPRPTRTRGSPTSCARRRRTRPSTS